MTRKIRPAPLDVPLGLRQLRVRIRLRLRLDLLRLFPGRFQRPGSLGAPLHGMAHAFHLFHQPPHVLAKGRILSGPFLFFLPAGGAFLQRCLRLFGTGLQLAVLFVQLIDQLPLTAQNFDQIRPAQLAQFFIVHRKFIPLLEL